MFWGGGPSLKRRGLVILDDLTPEEHWPEEWRGARDGVRAFWLNDERLASTEVRVSEREIVILARRML